MSRADAIHIGICNSKINFIYSENNSRLHYIMLHAKQRSAHSILLVVTLPGPCFIIDMMIDLWNGTKTSMYLYYRKKR